MKNKDIETTLSEFYKKIPGFVRLSIYATFIMGMLCNLFIFTNKTVNHDDIKAEFIFNTGLDIASGRFMWLIIRKMTSFYGLPLFFGLWGMACLSISAGLMVYFLKVKKTVFVLLISALIATFPVNACYYSYLSISPIYYCAILFTVLGVFFVEFFDRFSINKKFSVVLGMVVSGLFVMMALGTYQSFLALFVGLAFMGAMLELIDGIDDKKAWFFKYLRYVFGAVLGYVFYFIATKIVTLVTETELRPYGGTDKMFAFDLVEMLKSVKRTYIENVDFYFTKHYISSKGFIIVNIILFCVLLAYIAVRIVKNIKHKKYIDALILAFFTVTLPFFINIIFFMMSGKSGAHILMKYAFLLPYILVIAVLSNIELKGKYILQWIAVLMSVLSIYYFTITTNQLYLRMYYNTKALEAFCIQLETRVSMVEDFNIEEPIFFANFSTPYNENYVTSTKFTEELQPFTWMGTDFYKGWFSASHVIRYIDFNHHITYVASNKRSREEEVMATKEFKEMPVFPNDGSVKRINGLVTVKFAN